MPSALLNRVGLLAQVFCKGHSAAAAPAHCRINKYFRILQLGLFLLLATLYKGHKGFKIHTAVLHIFVWCFLAKLLLTTSVFAFVKGNIAFLLVPNFVTTFRNYVHCKLNSRITYE